MYDSPAKLFVYMRKIMPLATIPDKRKRNVGQLTIRSELTHIKVGMTGLEPATTRPPDVYANQLRYIPNKDASCSKAVQRYIL